MYFDCLCRIFVDNIKQEEVVNEEKSTVANVVTNAAVEERKPLLINSIQKSDGNNSSKKSNRGAKNKKTNIRKSFRDKEDSILPAVVNERDLKYHRKLQNITKKEKQDTIKRNKKIKQRKKRMEKAGKKRKLEETLGRDDASE